MNWEPVMRRIATAGLVALLAAAAAKGAVYTVNSVADTDDGACDPLGGETGNQDCTLREAISASNATAERDVIDFDIPGEPGTGGQWVIALDTELPPLTDPVTIDGYCPTCDGATPNSLEHNSNAVIKVGIAPGTNQVLGLLLKAPETLIQGLDIRGFIAGIEVAGPTAGSSLVGNFIRDNGFGVLLRTSAGVGGPLLQERNVIYDNIIGVSASLGSGGVATIQGNLIGLTPDGSLLEGNYEGIVVTNDGEVLIGGAATGEGNVVSGNVTGITASRFFGGGTRVLGNYIGTDSTGSEPRPNGTGLAFFGGLIEIGDPGQASAANVIAYNRLNGIDVSSQTVGIRRNRIFRNGLLGIDLRHWDDPESGITENDPAPDSDQGGNHLQNFPILTDAETTGGIATISGFLESTPNTPFAIEFFGNSERELRPPDPLHAGGHGEGEFYLDTIEVTTGPEGRVSFSHPVATSVPWVSSTATNLELDETSEFSPPVPVIGDHDTVNDPGWGDDGECADAPGDCTLPEAVGAANSDPNMTVIHIALPGFGPHSLIATETLDIVHPTIIDGTTQEGWTEENPNVEIEAETLALVPFRLLGDHSTLLGLRFTNALVAVDMVGDDNVVQDSVFNEGFDANGARVQKPNEQPVEIRGEHNGVVSSRFTPNQDLAQIWVEGKRCVIANNEIEGGPEGFGGVIFDGDADDCWVGGNTIKNVTSSGIDIPPATASDSTGNTFAGNLVFDNGFFDIHLGVTSNDQGDEDAGPNNSQNYPVIVDALTSAPSDPVGDEGETAIVGTFNSAPNSTYLFEFFNSDECDFGRGEAEVILGTMELTTDEQGDAEFTFLVQRSVPVDSRVSATATDLFTGDTSEISLCAIVFEAPPFFPDISASPVPIDFGLVEVGSTSEATLTVTNLGHVDLLIPSITSPAASEFSIDQDGCSGQTLAPREVCTLTVGFGPLAEGQFDDSLVIDSNDPSEPSLVVELHGGAFPSTECTAPDHAVLENEVIAGSTLVTGCISVTVGPAVTVLSSGDLTVVGGDLVVFGDGVSVEGGGGLVVFLDSSLLP